MDKTNEMWVCIERREATVDSTYAMTVPTPTGGVVIRRGDAMVFVPDVDIERPKEPDGVGRLRPRSRDYRDA